MNAPRKPGLLDAAGRSFTWTEKVLFREFSVKKWLRLGLVAFLAGGLNFTGSLGGRSFGGSRPAADVLRSRGAAVSAPGAAGGAGSASALNPGAAPVPTAGEFFGKVRSKALAHLTLLAWAAGVLVLLFVLLVWLSARFEFVWFNAVREDSSEISGPFDAYRTPGNSLFRVSLALGAAWLVFLGLLGADVFSVASAGGAGSFSRALLSLLPALILVGGALLLLSLLQFFIRHFVVTIMGMDYAGFRPSFGKAWGILGAHKLDFLFYLALWLGMRMAAGILAVIVMLIVILVLFLGAGILFGGAYLLLVKAMGAKLVFAAFAVLAGAPCALLAVALLFAVQLPFAVFFRSFSLYFLSSLDCGYDPIRGEDA